MSITEPKGVDEIRIGITGSSGFIGWHLRCRLREDKSIQVFIADDDAFQCSSTLTAFTDECDVVVHLAGINRGNEDELYRTNIDLCKRLIDAFVTTGKAPHVIFASSIHRDRDSAYGRSKRASSEMFREWEQQSGGRFTDLVLPNVFGEHGQPFYNSVVATFCYQLATGEMPKIIEDQAVELIHVRDVTRIILETALCGQGGEIRPPGIPIMVSTLLSRLEHFSSLYRRGIIPRFESGFDLYLFNTYRSFLSAGDFPIAVELHRDQRGCLFEAVKTLHGGQCFLSTTRPGVTRGNHYHTRKFERFLVVKGDAIVRLRRLLHSDAIEYRVSGDSPGFIDIPVLHAHNITNVGDDDLTTLFWAQELFDPSDADTYPEDV